MSSKTSLIRHPAGSLFVTIREHYVAICAKSPDSACSAALLHIFVHWQDYKESDAQQVAHQNALAERLAEPPVDSDAWFWLKQSEMREAVFNIWAEKKISACVKWLEAEGFIKSRRNPRVAFDKVLQYQVQIAELQKRIDEHEIESAKMRLRERQNAASREQKDALIDAKMRLRESKKTAAISQDSSQESLTHESAQESSLAIAALIEKEERLIFLLDEYAKIFGDFKKQLSEDRAAALVDSYRALGDNQFIAILARCANHGGQTWHYVVTALLNALETSREITEQSLGAMSWTSEVDYEFIEKNKVFVSESINAEIWRDDALNIRFTVSQCFDAALRHLKMTMDRNTSDYFDKAQLVDYRFENNAHHLTILFNNEYAKTLALKLSRNFLAALAQTMNLSLSSMSSDEISKHLHLISLTKEDWSDLHA